MAVRLDPYKNIVGVGWNPELPQVASWRLFILVPSGESAFTQFGHLSGGGGGGLNGAEITVFRMSVEVFLTVFPPPEDPEAPYKIPWTGSGGGTLQIQLHGLDKDGGNIFSGDLLADGTFGVINVPPGGTITFARSARLVIGGTGTVLTKQSEFD